MKKSNKKFVAVFLIMAVSLLSTMTSFADLTSYELSVEDETELRNNLIELGIDRL